MASKNPVYLANVLLIVKKTISLANQPPLSGADLGDRTADWMEELEPEVPMEFLPECFKVAKNNHASTFPINCHEIISAWRDTIKPRMENEKLDIQRKAEADNPVLRCIQKHRHINDEGETVIDLFESGTDDIAPCYFCRATDYENWKKTQIALYGQVKDFIRPSEQSKKGDAMTNVFEMFRKQPEEILSLEEIAELQSEHNALVCQIVDDPKTQKDLIIIFDEGANCFKHPESAYQTYRAKDIRRKIESYKKIVSGNEAA